MSGRGETETTGYELPGEIHQVTSPWNSRGIPGTSNLLFSGGAYLGEVSDNVLDHFRDLPRERERVRERDMCEKERERKRDARERGRECVRETCEKERKRVKGRE